ncbi:hypothetical protein ONE63_008550 [Megalurothrips usitatus]|uniref:ABC transporter domain-containing protein n=1 Tax=Megalurothrips usitatus TaxID=439358 RepID=A0AAV7XLI4_9NEOP|nr:hypothetical protein ONE63_008550 [Megalurothrips usitatus]
MQRAATAALRRGARAYLPGVPGLSLSLLLLLYASEWERDRRQENSTSLPARPGRPPRQILRSVTGRLRPGRLTAILGPSGAGKTSCLSILAGQRAAGVSGRVLVNGAEAGADAYRQHCVLIAQELALLGALTTRETLRVAADLKMPGSKYSAEDRQAAVTRIAETLGLEGCLDTAVAHLSGGEKKRLSIGVELVTNPPIMLFDEPTSGLDSVSSVQVVTHLRLLALAGRTVAVVLHQPSSRLFQLFDDVLVMGTLGQAAGPGRSLYCGPADHAAAAFSAAGANNSSVAVVEVASGEHGLDVGLQRVNEGRLLVDLPDDEASETDPMLGADDKKAVVLEMERTPTSRPSASPLPARSAASYPVSFWVQFGVLFRRSLLISWRDMVGAGTGEVLPLACRPLLLLFAALMAAPHCSPRTWRGCGSRPTSWSPSSSASCTRTWATMRPR